MLKYIKKIINSVSPQTSTSDMDNHTLNNWKKIKETFEKSGNTDNMYYMRACTILRTGVDPFKKDFTISTD